MKNNASGMTLIVKTVTRLTVGLILIYGIYIVTQGHMGPGGGFAGGVIVALSFVHLMLAFGKEAVIRKLNEVRGIVIGSLAALLFLSLIAFTLIKGGAFRAGTGENFKILGAGIIPFCDIVIAIMAGAVLFVVFLALVRLSGNKEEK